MSRLLIVAASALSAAMACAPRTHYLHYDAVKEEFLPAPTYVRTGDRLVFAAHDTLYGHRWTAKVNKEDPVMPPRIVVQGATDLGKLTVALKESVVPQAHTEESTPDKASGSDYKLLYSIGRDRVEVLKSQKPPEQTKSAGEVKRAVDIFVVRRDTLVREACKSATLSASSWIFADASRMAYLRLTKFLIDSSAAFAKDAVQAQVVALRLDSVSAALMDWSSIDLQKSHSDTLQRDVNWIARRLTALSSITGKLNVGAVSNSPEFQHRFGALQVCLGGKHARTIPIVAATEDSLVEMIGALETEKLAQLDFLRFRQHWRSDSANVLKDPIIVAGYDVAPIVNKTHSLHDTLQTRARELRELSLLIARIQGLPQVVAGYTRTTTKAMHQQQMDSITAGYLKGEKALVRADTQVVGTFWASARVTITPTRADRFSEIVLTSPTSLGISVDPPKASPEAPEAPSPAEGPDRTAGGGADKPAAGTPPKSDAPATPAASPAVTGPTLSIDIQQPARFQLSVGVTRSGMRTTEYEVVLDTVEGRPGTRITETGYTPNRTFATALLSYYLIPTRSKVFSVQADAAMWSPRRKRDRMAAWLQQSGLALSLGLALDKPLERIFLGASTEPLPGLVTSIGMHFMNTQRSAVPLTNGAAFVPRDSLVSPVVNRWGKPAFAWNVALDPQIVLGSFGKLLGLK